MPVWQVEFAIVPKRTLASTPRMVLAQVMDTNWWSTERLPPGYAHRLGAIAAPGAPPTPDVQTWGAEDGNRIDVWSVDGQAVRMTARVDVRRLDAKFSALLLQFARTARAVLVRRDGIVVEPIVGAFGAALRTSDAWQHASDPAAFFASYSKPEDDDE